MRKVAIGAIAAVVGLAATGGAATGPANAATASFAIRATVPLHCKAQLIRTGMPTAAAESVALGQLAEYCNAPRGYRLMVRYTPGSLTGTTLRIGEDAVVLNGSGMATLSESPIPRIRSRMISAVAGEGGLQTDRLELFMVPIG